MESHIQTQTKQKTDSQEYPFCRPFIFKGDPVGIRTRDPQLRRLLLYPAELPDQSLDFFQVVNSNGARLDFGVQICPQDSHSKQGMSFVNWSEASIQTVPVLISVCKGTIFSSDFNYSHIKNYRLLRKYLCCTFCEYKYTLFI